MSGNGTTPIIEVDGIATRFGRQIVHEEVSFAIEPGTVVALIGASGSGKTVLLKEIIRLLRPTAGRVRLFGEDIWSTDDERQLSRIKNRFGVLFQNGALFSALTVGENVALPLRESMRLPPELVRSVVELRLRLSGLDRDVAAKMPSELSGGMVKRAGLARALALEPELLFLDEPTSGLDSINARAFDSLVRTLSDSLGLTVVLSTHDLETLEGIVDRIIVLGERRVLADGTLSEVRSSDHPWIRSYFSSRSE